MRRVVLSDSALIALFCVAQILGMLNNGAFPALIPLFQQPAAQGGWGLSNTEAGWVSGIYYAGYAAAVPLLVSLTDREDPWRIYLASTALGGLSALGFALAAGGFWSAMLFRFLSGIGLAGTYMVGLKLLSDRISAQKQSRAVAIYTAHFAIGAGLSVLTAGEVAAVMGWPGAFAAAALGSLAAFLLVGALVMPQPRAPRRQPLSALLDFRPVFANRPALAYILAYSAHIWELFALRAWLVAFLTFALAVQPGGGSGWAGFSATQLATFVLLLGLPASIAGNELAVRFGRRRALTAIMLSSALLSCIVGFSATLPFAAVFALFICYGTTVMGDSGALTAGAVLFADPARRGATMAVHSLLGFGTGFLSPLAFGVVLDLAGGSQTRLAWGLAFALLGAGVALGPLFLARLGRDA
jgi:MFS family permease